LGLNIASGPGTVKAATPFHGSIKRGKKENQRAIAPQEAQDAADRHARFIISIIASYPDRGHTRSRKKDGQEHNLSSSSLFMPEDPVPPARIADASDSEALKEAAQIIRNGGLVAFPTETVYGLGADAGNSAAVARIFEVKARPRIDPVIIHVADFEGAKHYGNFPEDAGRLVTKFWPGPLTLIVDRKPSVAPIVTAGLTTVAIRMPAHPAALALIREAGCGIAAPSANPFGYVSPTEAGHVAEQLGDVIDMILDGGSCAVGLESTILSLAGPAPRVLRVGGIALEELELMLGKLDIRIDTSSKPQAPGQLMRHYATHTPLEIAEEIAEKPHPNEKVGLLSLTEPDNRGNYDAVEILSPSGDLREAAANLFRALRRLDTLSLDRIIARPVCEKDMGRAIMDRLRRCSARK
jgi:L-threonylcarbamoyladenylate synthase